MKFLVLLSVVVFAAAYDGRSYTLTGGFKEQGKYVYHYEAFMHPGQVSEVERQFAKLHLNGTLELHFLRNDKVVLQITEHNIFECYSDPKNMSGVYEKRSTMSDRLSRKFLKKPIKFVYTNGLVQQIYAQPDDPDWSVNMKKAILNMIHIDVTGKDQETGLKDLFQKEEVSIFGICQTTYSHKVYEIVDGHQMRQQIGMNFTKAIDYENCTGLDYDVFNKVVQGRNENQDGNPLKTSATIKYNLTGTENKFKIEGVTAKGLYVLYPFSKQQGGIASRSLQRLRLIREEGSLLEKQQPHVLENLVQRGKLIMKLPNFHKPDIFPPLTPADRERKAIHIRDVIKHFTSFIPSTTPVQSIMLVPEMSITFLEIVNNLRDCDLDCLTRVWQKCTGETRKWLVYAISLCHTENCLEFMRTKIPGLKEEYILDFLSGLNFAGKPTKMMLTKMKQICNEGRISNSKLLTKACWISSSNLAKGFCKVNRICKSWVENEISTALQKIPTACAQNPDTCEPIKHLNVHTVMTIAENLGRPSFLMHLETIIFNTELPTNIRMHAISCCRPILRQSPKRVQILLLRFFRDFKYDSQLRTLAFSVLMEQPHPHIIQITARHLLTEPSVNIRKFVHEVFTEISKSMLFYNTTVRDTCKVVLRMYHKLYVPSKMTSYRSQHMAARFFSSRWNVGAEIEGNNIANNRSYIPRFSQSRIRASILGRKFEVLDMQLYMQGIQDYINWMMSMVRPTYDYDFFGYEKSEEEKNLEKSIGDISKKTGHIAREPESLVFEGQIKLFDKLVSVSYWHLNRTGGFMEHFMTHLPEIIKYAKQMQKGKIWTWFKPIMPVEVMYTVPSLIGIPLGCNMTSVVLPYAKSALKLEMQPDPFSAASIIQRKKLEFIKVSGTQQLNSLTEVRGKVFFRLPFLEVGALTRKVMNTSVEWKGMVSLNLKTGEYNEECIMPKKMEEILYTETESAHYIKPSREPIKKVNFEADQFGKVSIINVTRPCEGQCRAEEWVLRTSNGKYLSVQNQRVVLKSQPFTFKVIFHGVNRRIISLYVPGKGYVVMSRKSPCLFVKQTNRGKYFVVDFKNLEQTQIKTLVMLESVPSQWDVPNHDELEEIRRYESLFMKEMVILDGEEYIDQGELTQSKRSIRLTYLKVKEGSTVCVSPKESQAISFNALRNTNLTTILTRYSYGNRSCIGRAWGFNLCVHGYYPEETTRSLPTMLYTPMKYRVTCRPDQYNKVTLIKSHGSVITNATNLIKYAMDITLVGSTPAKSIRTEVSWYRQDYRLKIDVLPSHFDLLRFKKMCYREHFKPDNYSLRISVHPECAIDQVKIDMFAPKRLPRHQVSFRINFTNNEVPRFWRWALSSAYDNVVLPILRNSSDYHFSNMSYWKNYTMNVYRNLTYNGTTNATMYLTRNDTISLRISAPSETWVWEDIKLNAYIRSLPIGSRHMPVVFKMYWTKGKACCQHRNSTFITFDKVVYNYTLKRQCDHVLLRSCYKRMPQFVVTTRKIEGIKNQMKRVVTTYIEKYRIEFIPGKKFSSRPSVLVNGQKISFETKYTIYKDGMPCIYIVWEPKLFNVALYHVQTGLYASLRRSFKVQTSVAPSMFAKVCGLCGNYNGEPKNEFVTPEGRIIRDVQKPKLYDPELEFYQENIFGNSWFIPSKQCVRDGCKFSREHTKVEQPSKYCLTSFKVPQCVKSCKPVKTEQIKVPIVCVARNESAQLNSQLRSGQPVTLFTAREKLVPINLPIKCSCPCGNKYKYFDSEEEDYAEPSYSDYWSEYYHHIFDEY